VKSVDALLTGYERAAGALNPNAAKNPRNGTGFTDRNGAPDADEIEHSAGTRTPNVRNKWKVQTAAEIFQEGVAPLEYDIDKLLPMEDGPAIFFGPPGSLKSLLALHAAICSVTGEPFLGRFSVRRRKCAVYVNLDAGDRTFKRRVLKFGFNGTNLHVTSPEAFDASELRGIFEQYPGGFIVVDAFADCHAIQRGDDQAQVMRRFVRDLRALYSKHECNGIIVDHPRRPRDGESHADYYGSVQKEATARIMWTVGRLPAGSDSSEVKVKISCRKMSEGETFEPFVAKAVFLPGSVTLTYDGTVDAATGRVAQGPTDTEIIEQILRGVDVGMSRTALQSRTGFSRDAVLLAIKQSSKIHTRGKTKTLRYHLLDSTVTPDELPYESPEDPEMGPLIRTDSSVPLDGRTSTVESAADFAGLDSYGSPNESTDESL